MKGKLHYFGNWARRENGKLVRVPDDGWEKALAEYERNAANLHAGRTPRTDQDSVDVAELIDRFLTHKRTLLDNGE